MACMAVVRASSRVVAQPQGGAPPPPARPPPPAPVSAYGIFKRFYDGFVGDPLVTTKALSLQVLFLPADACLYRNERVVGAGTYDDAIKTWITENEATLVGKLRTVPFADSGPLLRLIVATAASGTGAAARSGAGAGAADKHLKKIKFKYFCEHKCCKFSQKYLTTRETSASRNAGFAVLSTAKAWSLGDASLIGVARGGFGAKTKLLGVLRQRRSVLARRNHVLLKDDLKTRL